MTNIFNCTAAIKIAITELKNNAIISLNSEKADPTAFLSLPAAVIRYSETSGKYISLQQRCCGLFQAAIESSKRKV
ncbi:MAG: hypothetical protein Tsb0015_14970 [Simkaniaceae bacterium]